MSDSRDSERDPTAAPYFRLPTPVVAAALVVFLAGLLGLGIYANRNLRPQGIVVPTPAAQAAPTQTPPPVAVVAPSTATPVPVVATTAPTPLILTLATPTASPPPRTEVPTATSVAQVATESPTPLPTVEPTLAAEVGKAYENFWRVRSQAALTLDSTHLSEVMNGSYLEHFLEVLSQLQSEGKAIQTQVSLNYTVVQANNSSAIVHDRIQDNSFYVELGTNEPLSDPETGFLRIEFTLEKLEGMWKVVDSAREE